MSKPAQQNDPRTRFKHRGRRSLVARLPPSPEARKLFGRPTNPGAESAKADLKAKTVTVQGTASAEALSKAIADAGYKTVEG